MWMWMNGLQSFTLVDRLDEEYDVDDCNEKEKDRGDCSPYYSTYVPDSCIRQ